MSGFAMDFASVDNGGLIDLVCSVMVFDNEHTGHLLKTRNGSVSFLCDGCLTAGFTAYTLFNVCLITQFPVPKVAATKDTVVLGHHHPTWDSCQAVVDLCSGFGGMAQGALAAGLDVVVAVDQNEHMVNLHAKANDAYRICGDVGSKEIIHEVWESVQRSLCGFFGVQLSAAFRGWEMGKANWTPVQVVSPKHWMLPIFSMLLL